MLSMKRAMNKPNVMNIKKTLFQNGTALELAGHAQAQSLQIFAIFGISDIYAIFFSITSLSKMQGIIGPLALSCLGLNYSASDMIKTPCADVFLSVVLMLLSKLTMYLLVVKLW